MEQFYTKTVILKQLGSDCFIEIWQLWFLKSVFCMDGCTQQLLYFTNF